MSDYGPKLSLKVAINKQKSKVVFAEASCDFVDLLLSFLTLPLGKIVRILQNHSQTKAAVEAEAAAATATETPVVVGSITSLYKGLSNLDVSHFCVGSAKEMLLDPKSWLETELRRLKLDVAQSRSAKYFVCADQRCPEYEGRTISVFPDTATCRCGLPLNRALFPAGDDGGDGVFVTNDSSFIISDDLRVVPLSAGFLQTLDSLGIADADEAELTSLSLGIHDIMKLLQLSLTSPTPLTDLILNSKHTFPTAATKPEPGVSPEKGGVSTSKKMVLSISIQKSTNKFLFAQARDDFLDFIFSFLTFPLAGVVSLLGGNTSFKCIDNLYRSVAASISEKYFRASDVRNGLINPKIAYGCVSEKRFLCLDEGSPPELYFELLWSRRSKRYYYGQKETCYYHTNSSERLPSFTWSKGLDGFVKEQKMCIVRDDLTVTPYSIASVMEVLNSLRIPMSDVRETEFHIGHEEALSILKASLTSSTAISDALITPMLLNKKLKQEI